MLNDILLLVVLLILSGFFSSSEIAFIVANKIKIELRARKGNLYARNAAYFIKNPEYFFSTILISNNVINIAFASITSLVLLTAFGLDEYEILIISTILLLLFGELIPKYLAREYADSLILIASVPLRLIYFILYPIVGTTSKISSILSRINKKEEEEILEIFDKEDIHNLLEESSQAGKVDEEQSDIIGKVIDIREQRVYEAMTPRIDIVGVEITDTCDSVLDKFIESGYSKFVVYEENLDNIKGIILMKDFFKRPTELSSIIREAVFVPETKKSLEMLNEFMANQYSIAIVVDEFGGTAGIITIEDIIEELFGEISDEYDVKEKLIRKVNNNTFLLSGKVEIDRLNEEFDFNIEEGDYETIAGYITSKLGRIPLKSETFKIDQFTIKVLKSDKTKIDLIKLVIDLESTE